MLAKAPPERLAQVLWAGVELPGQLAVLRERLVCLEEGPLKLLNRELDRAQASGSRLERFVEFLAASLRNSMGTLRPLGRRVQEAQEASRRLEQRLGVIIQRTLEMERTLGQLGQLAQVLQLQQVRSQQELGEVKESVAELTSGGSTMQQLENIWYMEKITLSPFDVRGNWDSERLTGSAWVTRLVLNPLLGSLPPLVEAQRTGMSAWGRANPHLLWPVTTSRTVLF
ncbi:uncharacterized protein LOC119516029 [Choloepus didactylus]|uniref:uncharacterized protein LOC119516029 n=1 Tax=Choloepus didactylus TaxID=27675 RepID=UPI00189FE23F|nr:uncharacterized protein LOC119516029 [Choloepus didactylus]